MASVHDIAAHELGFEEGIFWLPSHVMDEACDSKVSNTTFGFSLFLHIHHTHSYMGIMIISIFLSRFEG